MVRISEYMFKSILTMFWVSVVLVSLVAVAASEPNTDIQKMFETLPPELFTEYFNSLNLSYTISHHNRKQFSYGVIPPTRRSDLPVIKHQASPDVPENFDSRVNWPQCQTIQEIYNQGQCGACWTFGSTTTASDRTCIHKGITVRFSQQDLGCCTNCFTNTACDGGFPDLAFQFWIDEGLVSQECKPYDIDALRRGECTQTCVNGKDYNSDKIKGSSYAQVSPDDASIKMELSMNGPIEASMAVYEDFERYTTGIYEHQFGILKGHHSIRVIGYGVENGVDYWLGANSWDTVWGENGFFRIKRFQPDIEFENRMLSCLP